MFSITWRARRRPLAALSLAVAIAVIGWPSFANTGASRRQGKAPSAPVSQVQLPTTIDDFFQPGTQPDPTGTIVAPVLSASNCTFCHASYLPDPSYEEPGDGWVNSLMAQSARDPVWYAALAIANQDANMAGEFCIRCHSPTAWLRGHSVPPDASAFVDEGMLNDFDGVTCHFCHRSVNPVLEGDSPVQDMPILAGLSDPPGDHRGNGRYVVDPSNVRRGPYQDIAITPGMNMHGVPVIYSPFHRRSEMCATCHDVANPNYMRQPDGTYAPTALGQPHPTQDPYDMFPEQMTYSEWKYSQFASGGVQFNDGRFGGSHPTGLMQECQDCHMPEVVAGGCFAWEFPPFFERPDLGYHTFNGANHWALRAIRAIYPDSETRLSEESVIDAEDRTIQLLRAASDTLVQQVGGDLKVRVVNWSGHKLPTGYPEGRRMWLNVKFFDETDDLIAEYGEYDLDQATLDDDSTKVYETKHVIDSVVAGLTNLNEGEEFHLALNNLIELDNRIPPVGFTNAGYQEFGSAPVGATYADGQHWDDTHFVIPWGAVRATVTLNYQAATREYMEFLRDRNVTNTTGDQIYALWEDPAVGNMVPPVDMDSVDILLGPPVFGDLNGSGSVGFDDLLQLLAAWGPCPPPQLCPADLDCDGLVGFNDLLQLLAAWS